MALAQVEALLAELSTPLSSLQKRQLATYLEQLQRWNKVYNLTGVVEPSLLVQRHVAECLALRDLLVGERIADMGSGAGLPGLILAVAEPHRRFWLMESVGKKTRFLTHVCGELGLENVHVYHGRIEDFPVTRPFDTVVARALAPVVRLVMLARHLLGSRGKLVALKGDRLEAELAKLPSDFHVQTITTLASASEDEPSPRAVIIAPNAAK